MESALRVALLLLLLTGAVKGSDLSDDNDHGAAAQRPKRWSGLSLFGGSHGKGTPSPTRRPAGGVGVGFNLADAVRPDPKAPKPAGGNGFAFDLEDALRPAQKPTVDPSSCQGNLIEKLNAVIENQNQQLRLLKRMTPTSRFYQRGTR